MKCRKEIRLTSAELEELQKQAAEMGVTDSQFLRMLFTNRPRDYPAIRQELQRLNNEINHIGVNINQITCCIWSFSRFINTYSRCLSSSEYSRLKDQMQQVIDKL